VIDGLAWANAVAVAETAICPCTCQLNQPLSTGPDVGCGPGSGCQDLSGGLERIAVSKVRSSSPASG